MKIYSQKENYTLYNGSMLDMLEYIKPNSIDSIITDPPYELNFMGKDWDNSGIAFSKDTWRKCYEVLKPGGYLLAFGGSRTFHRIACAIEDAGFEIRDTIMYLYGTGFPKSMNIGLAIDKKNGIESPIVGVNEVILKKQAKDIRENHRKILDSLDAGSSGRNNGFKTVSADIREAQNEWAGWGTCLKPAFEPVIMARKPCEGSCIDNVLKYGVGGINIDECRVPMSQDDVDTINSKSSKNPTDNYNNNETKKYGDYSLNIATRANENGRFPANIITDGSDEVAKGFPQVGNGNNQGAYNYAGIEYNNKDTSMFNGDKPQSPSNYNDSGSAMRYFYCAKASKKDRDEGLDEFEEKQMYYCDGRANSLEIFGTTDGGRLPRKNIHPTVKPTNLMQYLIRLVSPKGATILDPFMGSGSTGKATMFENNERNAGYKFIGIELTDEYLPICEARISYASNEVCVYNDNTSNVVNKNKQLAEFEKVSLI